MRRLSDEALIAEFASGNAEAFDILLERHQDNLYGYIFSLVQNHHEAEDVFQETFAKVIVTIRNGRYADSGKFIAYLEHVARNMIIDNYRRSHNVEMVSPQDVGYDTMNSQRFSEGTIEDDVSYRELLDEVRRLVTLLPPDQAQIIQMHYYQGLSFKQIAHQLGISINTALGRSYYAVQNMRKIAKRLNISLAV